MLKMTGNLLLALALASGVLVLSQRNAHEYWKGGSASGDLPADRGGGKKNLHSGIILLPDTKPYVLLLPFPHTQPPQLQRTSLRTQARPLTTPFSGEYWFFHSLFRRTDGKRVFLTRSRPPASSLVERGNPLSWTLTSVDSRLPLVMKAHQPLLTPVNLFCCGGIDVAVSNVDTQPGTLTAELILTDSKASPEGVQSLGQVPMPPGLPESILKFSVPPGSALHRFDAIDVVIHLGEPRRNRSANLAIIRFDLIPRAR